MELTRNQRCRGGLFLAIVCPALAVFFVASAGRLEAVDFLRGDVNGDREVSFADGAALLGFLFYSFPSTLECLDAADKNDNGTVDISDAIGVLTYVTQHAAAPAEPFPVPGPDPTPDRIGIEHCGSYGGGSFLDDAAALMKLSGAPAAGGEDSRAEILIEISNSAPVIGYHGKIGLPDGLVSRVNQPWREDILVGDDYFYMLTELSDTTLEFSFLGPILSNRTPIPAGDEVGRE